MTRRTLCGALLVSLAGCGLSRTENKSDTTDGKRFFEFALDDDSMAGNTTDTKLLMHFDDQAGVEDVALGRTTGGGAKLITNTGTTQSTIAKWGKAAYFDGGTFVTIQPHADFNFGIGNWTVDFWTNVPAFLSRPIPFAWYLDSDNYCTLIIDYTIFKEPHPRLLYKRAGVMIVDQLVIGPPGIPTGLESGWNHVVLMGLGTQMSMMLNGVSGQIVGGDPTIPLDVSDFPLYIGFGMAFQDEDLHHVECYVDEFRVHAAQYWFPTYPVFSYPMPTFPYTSTVTMLLGGSHNIRQPLRFESLGSHGMGVGSTRMLLAGAFNQTKGSRYESAGNHRINPVSFELAGGFDLVHHAQRFETAGQFAQLRESRYEIAGAHNLTVAMRLESAGTHNVTTAGSLQSAGSHNVMRRVRLESVGNHEIAGDILYELYYAFGAAPNLDGAPWETFANLPHTTAVITGEGFHYFVLRLRSKAGILSQNIEPTIIELDASDNQLTVKPIDPSNIAIADAGALTTNITADYFYLQDSGREADTWNLYVTTNGVDPNPATDTPIAVAMNKTAGAALLDYTTAAASEGATVKAIVRALRTSDSRESGNTAVLSTTVSTTGPTAPTVRQIQSIDGVPTQIA